MCSSMYNAMQKKSKNLYHKRCCFLPKQWTVHSFKKISLLYSIKEMPVPVFCAYKNTIIYFFFAFFRVFP